MKHVNLACVAVLVVMNCASCVYNTVTDPTAPPPAEDTPADCQSACDRLRELGCREGQTAPGSDRTCEQVCNNVAESGVSLNTKCVVEIQSCDQVSECAE